MKQEIKERVERIRKGEVPEGFKKTKMGIYSEDWALKKLSEITDVRDGTHESPEYVNEGIPFITSKNLLGNEIDWQTINYITKKDHLNFSKRSKVDDGDILFGMIGTIGNPTLVKKEFEFSIKNVALIKFGNSEINNIYLLNVLKSNIINKQFHQQSNSAVQQFIALGTIRNLIIPMCKTNEQNNITNILSIWDKAIELKEKLIEEKKEFKKGLMHNLLTGKIRFPEFNDEWVGIPLKNIVKRITTKNKENNKTVVTISAKKGFINQDEYFNKLVASKDLSGYFLIKKGDFAYNKSYSNGYPVGAIKRLDSFENAVVTTLYICFRKKDGELSNNFLKYYFDSGLLNRQIKRIANEGGRAHGLLNVTPSDFFNIKLNLPKYEEQEKISATLLVNEQEIQLLEQDIFELKEQKRGLMQLLLTGIVRVEVD